jgi:hypothetical protein
LVDKLVGIKSDMEVLDYADGIGFPGGVLVVVVGVAMFFLIRRYKSEEPPHLR